MPGAGLRRLGKVMHLSKSGNLIIRLDSTAIPSTGTNVCNYKLETVGIVNNVLGPVKNPYASIQPATGSADTLAGRVLYLVEKD